MRRCTDHYSSEIHQVCHAAVVPGLLDEHGDLAAMMGLMIEQMQRGNPERLRARRGIAHRSEGQGRAEYFIRKRPGPKADFFIGGFSLASHLVEIGVQLLIERSRGKWLAVESAQPHAVGKQQVIKNAADGTERCAGLALAGFVRHVGANGIQFFIHPAIVARHHSKIFEVLHNPHFALSKRPAQTR